MEVSPKGGKYWRFKYRFADKERRMGFGVYPDIGLANARDMREAARKLVAKGIDPSEQRKAEKISRAGGDSFEAIAREWHARNEPMKPIWILGTAVVAGLLWVLNDEKPRVKPVQTPPPPPTPTPPAEKPVSRDELRRVMRMLGRRSGVARGGMV